MHVLLAKLSGQANDPSALESSGTKRRATPTEHAAAVKVVSYTVRMFLKSICYSVIGCYVKRLTPCLLPKKLLESL